MIDNYDNIVESLFTISYFLSLIFLFQQLYKASKFFANRHSDYQSLLEFPNNYKFDSLYLNKNFDAISNELLVKDLDDFCIKNGIYNNRSVILSLSGGVDSMVTLACLLHLQKKYNNSFEIYTATIDYSLRKESKYEADFLKKYTKTMGVQLVVASVEGISRKKEGSGSRTEFEEGSRNLRFNTYKKIITDNNLSLNTGVLVGHHQDDIIENIFTNSMRGANIMDLEVMKPVSTIHGVKIFRPFIHLKKDVIYKFSHTYNVPYFLDTTPLWSNRGKMRNAIFPLLDSVFTKAWRDNLKHLGSQSNDWGEYVEDYIINPWFEEIELNHDNSYIKIPIKDQPKLIYSNIIMKSLHSIGEKMIKRTSMDKIMELLNKKTFKMIDLDGHRAAFLSKNLKYIVIFNRKNVKNINKLYVTQI
jgi:tRNA(Ile)-lysidine synthetase-like protein